MNTIINTDKSDKHAVRDALLEMVHRDLENASLAGFDFTLNFNRDTSLTQGKRSIKRFAAQMDYHCLGAKWAKKPRERRLGGVLLPEYGKQFGRLHYHGVLILPYVNLDRFFAKASLVWKGLVASGETNPTTYRPVNQDSPWNWYCTKVWNQLKQEEFVFPVEFHP